MYPALEPDLQTLVAEGRGVGCHAILGTQRPSAQVVKGIIKANIPARFVGVCVSAREATLAAGYPESGAQHLTRGQFVAVGEGGGFTNFVAPLVRNHDVQRVVQSVSGRPSPTNQKVIEFATERLRLEAKAAKRPGMPAYETPPSVLVWLLEHHDRTGKWPSKRSIQRRLGELAGVQLASITRANRALEEARDQASRVPVVTAR